MVLISTLALAQGGTPGYSPPEVNIPWNQYIPSRIPDGYSTIIGQSGTTILASNTTGSWLIAMPFPFYFMGTNYPTGYYINVATAGYFSFNGSTTNTYTYPAYVQYQTSPSANFYTHVVAPYWSDIYTYGVTDAGVYYRTTGTAPNRVLTIEWRAQGVNYPGGNPGNFQAKLYEGTSNIEFHYGPNSIDRTVPTSGSPGYGAFIGLKKYGQTVGQNPAGTNDDDKFLWFLHPDQTINGAYITGGENPGRDTIAITRMRTGMYVGTIQYYFEYYAYIAGYLQWYGQPTGTTIAYIGSPYYHY
jgi:hypothetical protein